MPNEDTASVNLIEAVDSKVAKVRTRSLDVSFNELADMFSTDELKIDPEYQRLFRWSEEQQSRFIESLILELPIPPIFVIEESEGVYELIDGLQRISSYLHFRGVLPSEAVEGELPFEKSLRLQDCDIVKELNGRTYDSLPKALEIRLKRNFVRMEVIRKESDPRLRYYMFKRLNTGGAILSPQEVRNCTIRLLDNQFNKFIITLSSQSDFVTCIRYLSDDQKKQKYDQELVLRFFAFKNDREHYVHDVGPFMTDYMEAVSDVDNTAVQFDYDKEKAVFEKTFSVLRKTLGDKAFSKKNERGNFISAFLSYHYEAFALGIQPYLDQLDPSDSLVMKKLKAAFNNVKDSNEFKTLTTGGGKNFPGPLADRIGYVEKEVGAALS